MVAFDLAGGQAVLFNPTAPHLTGFEMRELIEWTCQHLTLGEFHPIIVIANFIEEFLAIHPFHHGNGRLSRVLTNLLLAKSGYSYMPYVSLEKIIEDRKSEYYIALRTAQKDEKSARAEMARWLHFFIDVMVEQIVVLKKSISSGSTEVLLSLKQNQALSLFDRSPEISTKMLSEYLGISAASAKQILLRLLALKLVVRLGAGRAIRYKRM